MTDACPCGRGDHARCCGPLHAGGCAGRLEETSHFVREGGRWYYVDGDVSGD